MGCISDLFETSLSLCLHGKLDNDDYSSLAFWGKTSPKRPSHDLSHLSPVPESPASKAEAGAGRVEGGSCFLGGCSLLPSGPPSPGRQALSFAHGARHSWWWVWFPWTGTGWSPSHSAGSLRGAALPLPGSPSGKRDPAVCKLSFGN